MWSKEDIEKIKASPPIIIDSPGGSVVINPLVTVHGNRGLLVFIPEGGFDHDPLTLGGIRKLATEGLNRILGN